MIRSHLMINHFCKLLKNKCSDSSTEVYLTVLYEIMTGRSTVQQMDLGGHIADVDQYFCTIICLFPWHSKETLTKKILPI